MVKGCHILYCLLAVGIFVYTSCENNLREVEKVSSHKLATQIDTSKGVEIIYSDSAIVKAKIIAPELLHFKTDQPYYEMKKGVKAIFFDKDQLETSNVVADYAMSREHEDIIELRNNVVATNKEGRIFKSDELIWNSKQRRFYSTKLVTIITPSQTIHGTEFWANEGFTYYEIKQSTGDFDVSNKEGSGLSPSK
ncbi:MAG: LPS export ABC transporter periplasmic protein LptC [Sphingobacteriaceae bacterium]|nr:MAG: LPS export ABC transporter periplasmic protein LptC [Pedobacter sp.]